MDARRRRARLHNFSYILVSLRSTYNGGPGLLVFNIIKTPPFGHKLGLQNRFLCLLGLSKLDRFYFLINYLFIFCKGAFH